MLKSIPSGRTRVEELWREEAILDFEVQNVKFFADRTAVENLADEIAQKQ